MAETFAHPVPEEAHASHAHHPELSFFRKYIWSEDHKTIALQYLFTSMFFLLVGGLLAMGVRFQLAFPNAPVPLLVRSSQLVGDFFGSNSAGRLQWAGDYARHGHGLSRHHAVFDRSFRQLFDPPEDRSAGHGFPFFQCALLLAVSAIRSGVTLQLLRSGRFPCQWLDLLRSSLLARLYNGTQAGQSLWCVGSLYQRSGVRSPER